MTARPPGARHSFSGETITAAIRRIPRPAGASAPGHCCRARLRAGWRRGRQEPPQNSRNPQRSPIPVSELIPVGRPGNGIVNPAKR